MKERIGDTIFPAKNKKVTLLRKAELSIIELGKRTLARRTSRLTREISKRWRNA